MNARSRFGVSHAVIALAATLALAGSEAGRLRAQTIPAPLPNLKLATAGSVDQLAVQPDGKVLIYGAYTSVNDVRRNGLVRLNANGSLDSSWTTLALGQPNGIKALTVSGTNIYLGTMYMVIDGQARNGIARLSTKNGSLDAAWDPNVTGGAVETIAVSGSDVFIGGSFTNVAGAPRSWIAKLSAELGTPDNSWNVLFDGAIHALAVSGTNLFVAGAFLTVDNMLRPGLVRLSAITGALDTSFDAGLPTGANVQHLALSGTNLFIAGDFSSVGGQQRSGLAKLNRDGAVDLLWTTSVANSGAILRALTVVDNSVFIGGERGGRSFLIKADAGGPGTLDYAWQAIANFEDEANQNGYVNTLAATTTRLYVGGLFVKVGLGDTAALGIGAVDPVSGTRDLGFMAQAQLFGFANAMAFQADGRLIIGGNFQTAGGLTRRNLVRVSVDGQVDPTWSPDPDGEVAAVAVAGNSVFVAGTFTKVGGQPRRHLAKLATVGNDAADLQWDPVLLNSPIIYALAASGTNLYVGGGFLNGVGGQNRTSLLKLNTGGSGSADATWFADATNGFVRALALDGTNLFIGGDFTSVSAASRSGLAKVSALSGALDTSWNPVLSLSGQDTPPLVRALALNATDLFIGGDFTNVNAQSRIGVAKLSTQGVGALDALWSPSLTDGPSYGSIYSLAAIGTNLYVSGEFKAVNGMPVRKLARLSTGDTGAVDTAFAPNPDSAPRSLLIKGNDLYAAGSFPAFFGVARNGFVLQPVADAPVLIQESSTNFFIFRNPLDGPEVTHFRIVAIGPNSPGLYLTNGMQLHYGDFINVADGSAGLRFGPQGVVTVASAISPTPAGTGAATSTLTMALDAPPVFTFSANNYSVREGQGSVVVTVRKYGSGPASVHYSTVDQTAIGGVDYQAKSGWLSFLATEKFKNIVITIADDLESEGDEQFGVILNGVANDPNSTAATATVTIVDNDIVGVSDSFATNAPPDPQPVATGVLKVNLQPAAANGQWHLVGDFSWHNSGDSISGLATNNYQIEFRPVGGYLKPDSRFLEIFSGITNLFTFDYLTNSSPAGGKLSVLIDPEVVANDPTDALRGQWRQPGETNWHNSGVEISGLSVGDYSVEFKPVDGYFAPLPRSVHVGASGTYRISEVYLLAPSGSAPINLFVVPPGQAATNRPYCFLGQIQTSAGFGSGFVVKPGVVLTAAHVLYDDFLQADVTEVRWFFQRYRGQFEPVPQIPRGWYVFTGYSAQRKVDASPGVSSPESQQLDAAAMYFLEQPAGRGGFGGFVSTDAEANEYLLSANDKFLVGYPLDGVPDADRGKLHASMPTNVTFTHLSGSVFATADLKGFPGNSGGPLYVQTDVDTFYPAAIYLGGSNQTVVRAINSEVVDLINRADISSQGGANNTGGGVSLLRIGVTAQSGNFGTITVYLSPTNATNFPRPGWRVQGAVNPAYNTDPVSSVTVYAGLAYTLEFDSVPGMLAPTNYTTDPIAAQTELAYEARYDIIPPRLEFNHSNGLKLIGEINARYRLEFSTDLSSPTWTKLTTVTLTNTTLILPGTQPAAGGSRFYRAALDP